MAMRVRPKERTPAMISTRSFTTRTSTCFRAKGFPAR
jgi:hypothetical protein